MQTFFYWHNVTQLIQYHKTVEKQSSRSCHLLRQEYVRCKSTLGLSSSFCFYYNKLEMN